MGDCNLECLDEEEIPEEDEGVHEFVGPVRVILMEGKKQQYYYKTCGAAFVTFALFVLGATIMPVLFYTISFKRHVYDNIHVLLCTIGYQLFIPSGYLSINRFNGSTNILKSQDQKLDFAVLKVVAFLCIAVGSMFVVLSKSFNTYHAYLGIAANALLLLDILATLCVAVKAANEFTKLMILFGIPSFVCSSVCFMLAIMTTDMKTWFQLKTIPYFLCLGCIYYTLVVLYDPLTRNE